MNNMDPNSALQMLQGMLQPWYVAIKDPDKAQKAILHRLLIDYAKTSYGKFLAIDTEHIDIRAACIRLS